MRGIVEFLLKKLVVESRENKIKRKTEKFHGDEQTVLHVAGDFWDPFKLGSLMKGSPHCKVS